MTLLTHLDALANRAFLTFLAWQPAARPSGGGAPTGGGGGGPAAASGPAQLLNTLFPLLIVGFIYFFMLRPMNKQKKEQEQIQKGLSKGDRVVTSAGIIGTIHEIDEREVVLETTERTRVRVLRDTVNRKYDPAAEARAAQAKS